MPYKDNKDKIKYFRKWYKANKERMRSKRRKRDVARYYNPVPKKCEVRGCKNLGERHHDDYRSPKKVRWRCKKHHEHIHHPKKKITLRQWVCSNGDMKHGKVTVFRRRVR